MSKLAIASRLADEIGTTTAKAKKFVEEIGGDKASRLVDDLSSAGSRSVGAYATPAVLTGGTLGGGYLIWRQQDVEEAKALAEQSSSYNDAIQSIVESDLPPALKEELTDSATSAAKSRQGGGEGTSSFLDQIFGDPLKMVFALVIVIVVLQFVLQDGLGDLAPTPGGVA